MHTCTTEKSASICALNKLAANEFIDSKINLVMHYYGQSDADA